MSAPTVYEVAYKGQPHTVQVQPVGEQAFEVRLDDGPPIRIDLTDVDDAQLLMRIGTRVFEVETASEGDEITLMLHNWEHRMTIEDPLKKRLQEALGTGGPIQKKILADMPGKILQVLIQEGDTINAGDGLFIIEAMKMENEIKAAGDARVVKLHVQPGKTVETGDLLAELDEP